MTNSPINIFNNPWKKYRALKTVALYTSFFGLGLAASVLGPTVVSMEILLDTDTKSIAAAFSGGSFGYMSGAFLCGFIYAPLNKELLFSIAVFGVGLATALAPFSWHLYMFVAVISLQGFLMAMIDTAGQSYILKLWEGHQYKQSMMQGAHGLWSLGATTAPIIIRPFLADIVQYKEQQCNSTSTDEFGDNLMTFTDFGVGHTANLSKSLAYNEDDNLVSFTTDDYPGNCSTISEEDIEESIGFVRLAYVIIASLITTCSIMFIVAFFLMKPSCCDRTREKKTDEEKVVYTKSYKCFRVSLLVFMFFYYFIYLWVEGIPGSFLAAFVVKGLGWPNNHGALITSVYWGSHGLGRLLGIPVAACVSPRNMLIIDMVMTTVGFSLLLFVGYYEWLTWVGVAVAGLGMGTIFASAILWMEDYIEVTGAASSVLLTAASLGGILSPLLTGFLLDQFSYMCFVYVVFSASIVEILIFAGAYCYAQKNGRHVTRTKKRKRNESSGENGVEMRPLHGQQRTQRQTSVISDGSHYDEKDVLA